MSGVAFRLPRVFDMLVQLMLAAVMCQTAGDGTGNRYPVRVRNLLSPQRPRTSQIEWTVTWGAGYDAGLVERYITRSAGDTVWESNLGDENGYHRTLFAHSDNPSTHTLPGSSMTAQEVRQMGLQEAPKEKFSGPQNSMIYQGQVWRLNSEHPVSGSVGPIGDPSAQGQVEPTSVGLRARWEEEYSRSPFGLIPSQAEGLESASFSEASVNGRPTVSAAYGEHRLTWTFDDQQGGLPVETAFYSNDRLAYYSRTQAQQVAGRWLPRSVEFYLGDGATPYKVIDVQCATFDEPWHMQDLTPGEIGPVYGTQFSTPTGMKAWNGLELMDMGAFWELVNLFEVLPDQRWLEAIGKSVGKSAEQYAEILRRQGDHVREVYFREHGEKPWLDAPSPKEKDRDEWDVYVEQFLAKHKLPAPGVQRANEIRDQSKKLRDAYRRKNEAKLREAKKEGDPRKIAEYEGIEKRIFDNVLVRELNKLVQVEKDSPKKEP